MFFSWQKDSPSRKVVLGLRYLNNRQVEIRKNITVSSFINCILFFEWLIVSSNHSSACFAISLNLSHIDLFPSGSKIIDKNYHNFAWEYDADIRGGASFNHSSWAPVMSDIYWWLKQ